MKPWKLIDKILLGVAGLTGIFLGGTLWAWHQDHGVDQSYSCPNSSVIIYWNDDYAWANIMPEKVARQHSGIDQQIWLHLVCTMGDRLVNP
jgi:hypothetical protein